MLNRSLKVIISLSFILSVVLNGITPVSFAGNVPYTDDELCNMAKEYYSQVNGYVPPVVVIEITDGDEVTIHLYDIVDDHTATVDWYTVNRYTARGKNILEQDIDLSAYGNGSSDTGGSQDSDNIGVTVNGAEVSFDQPPIIVDNRTLVPLRAIFEAMGATVDWDQETQTVTSSKGDISVSLTIGSNTMYKNGSPVELDVPAQVVNGRTLVPVRAVSEAFGADVDWNQDTKTVIIEC